MDISERIQTLSSKQDLLELLNDVKSMELGDNAYPIELKQLTYYADPRKDRNRYYSFTIPKKSGGERTISVPERGLKSILTTLNTVLTSVYVPTDCAMGFVKGRSVVANAKVHIGQNYVFNIDLKDFFPSISKSRVWKRLTLPPFNFKSEIADIVAGLCTMKVVEGGETKYVLPQGAPTSPVITNMICQNLDRKLSGLARRFNLRYTRYADDITFSSMHNVYAEGGEFLKELHRIIAAENFTLNENKTRLQSNRGRREVTGLIVSDKINVPRQYVRDLRQMLYIWKMYGVRIATAKIFEHYVGLAKFGTPSIESIIRGKLLYLKMVKGGNDQIYRKLDKEFNALVSAMRVVSYPSMNYVNTYNWDEFEDVMCGDIKLRRRRTRAYAVVHISKDEEMPLKISNTIKPEVLDILIDGSDEEKEKICKGLQVSLLRNGNRKPGYFIHKRIYVPMKKVVVQVPEMTM